MSELMTVNEVAARFGVSVRTIRAWIAGGRIPSVKLSPRVLRVRAEAVEALITAGERGAS